MAHQCTQFAHVNGGTQTAGTRLACQEARQLDRIAGIRFHTSRCNQLDGQWMSHRNRADQWHQLIVEQPGIGRGFQDHGIRGGEVRLGPVGEGENRQSDGESRRSAAKHRPLLPPGTCGGYPGPPIPLTRRSSAMRSNVPSCGDYGRAMSASITGSCFSRAPPSCCTRSARMGWWSGVAVVGQANRGHNKQPALSRDRAQ